MASTTDDEGAWGIGRSTLAFTTRIKNKNKIIINENMYMYMYIGSVYQNLEIPRRDFINYYAYHSLEPMKKSLVHGMDFLKLCIYLHIAILLLVPFPIIFSPNILAV